jgi:hypothetical protein
MIQQKDAYVLKDNVNAIKDCIKKTLQKINIIE